MLTATPRPGPQRIEAHVDGHSKLVSDGPRLFSDPRRADVLRSWALVVGVVATSLALWAGLCVAILEAWNRLM